MEFRLEVTERDGWTVVGTSGEIDVATAPRLRSQLVELINAGTMRLVVDLSWVDFIDSTGLGVLIGALKRVRSREGTLMLVIDDRRVLKTFEITGLDQVFAIHPTVDSAVAA